MGTQALTRRWWAPEEPGIGPDEFDLRLLEPGNEPNKDLVSHLLAVHRVGAAACEAVATQPLADEVTLRGVLATARGMVAEPAVTAVSKAFDQPTYGAVLLADFLDDAEQAAVSIYRTCITKNIAPSIAAHRVGLIYGVPLRELGRYTMLATDPKADKTAVEELADRTLFGFVAKLAEEEAPTGAKELVSKAPARERPQTQTRLLQALFDRAETAPEAEAITEDDPTTPYYDARNRLGEFARTPTTTPRVVGRRTVGRREVKRRVVERPVAVEQAAGQIAGGQIAAGRVAGGRIQRGKLTREQQRLQKLLPDIEIPPVSTGTQRDFDPQTEYLSRVEDRNGPDSYQPLWHELSFVFPGDEWSARKQGMGRQEDEHGNETLLFRARALEGGGPFASDDVGEPSNEHVDARKHTVALIRNRPEHHGQPAPITKRIEGAASSLQQSRELLAEKRAFLREVADNLRTNLNTSVELGFVHAAASFEDADDLILVWQPPTPGRHAMDRPLVAVTEVFIEDESAFGRMEQSRYASDITVDPNQPLEAVGARQLWVDDPKGGYLLKQVEAIEGDETTLNQTLKSMQRKGRGFGKRFVVAKATNERSLQQLRQLQSMFDRADDYYGAEPGERNEQTGEFQRRGAAVSRRTVGRRTVGRRVVQPAELRGTGRAQLQGDQLESSRIQSGRLEQVQLSRGQVREIAQLAERGATEQTVFLDDGFHYTVLDLPQVGTLLDEANLKYLEQSYESSFVPGPRSAAMIAHGAVGPREARQQLITEAELRYKDSEGANWKQLGDSHIITSEADLAGVALDIEDRLGREPNVQMLRSVIHKRDDGTTVVTLHGNVHDMRDGHMIRMENTGSSTPIRLRPEGARRLMGRKAIQNWLSIRLHGGNVVGATGSTDYLPVPLVHTWAVEDHYDAP